MIYLDNAATSFPKPPAVLEETLGCMRSYCGNPGRGSHALAMAAAEKIYECREVAARFFGLRAPEQVIFTPNTTVALNIAIKGLVKPGDHVLISDMEHNAVWRPIERLAREGLIEYDLFPTLPNQQEGRERAILAAIRARIKPNTRMLVAAHASNLCALTLPLDAIGAICRSAGILFVVDAAQSAGHLPIFMERWSIDALCAPGHKGLLGPQGTGLLLLRKGLEVQTLIEGGSGLFSLDPSMPKAAPERFEAGTPATPAIAGLCAGFAFLEQVGLQTVARTERALNGYLQERLLALPGVTVYAPHRVGSTLLFSVDGLPAEEVGQALGKRGICVRTGYHCAALGHRTLGTPQGGAVRVSPGLFNTREDMDATLAAIRDVLVGGL